MIYDIPISGMDFRTPLELTQSGICPRCKSNANNPFPTKMRTTFDLDGTSFN
jgi:hypothetical protein